MAFDRVTLLVFSMASMALCAPVNINLAPNQAAIAKTNSNGTSTLQVLPVVRAASEDTFSQPAPLPVQQNFNDVPMQSTQPVLVPLTNTANVPVMRQADYEAQGRAELQDALGLMSSVLAPKFMQPGSASASMTPAATGPQVPVQQPQVTGFQQQQPNFQQQPLQGQFQQPAFAQPIQPQGVMDARMMPLGQVGYGQGYPLMAPAVNGFIGQQIPYAQMRSLPNTAPVQQQQQPQQTPLQQSSLQQQPQVGTVRGVPVQNTVPSFSNSPGFMQANQFPPANNNNANQLG